jgi:hypothetical protein
MSQFGLGRRRVFEIYAKHKSAGDLPQERA